MRVRLVAGLMAIVILAIAGCKKVINVSLAGTDSKYVIEGKLNNTSGCSVLLSTTEDINTVSGFQGVDSAAVTLMGAGDSLIYLTQIKKGSYYTSYTGEPGKTYSLRVVVNGNVFTASSTMPQQVNMNSLYVSSQNIAGKKQYVPVVTYSDPAAVANYYNFVQVVNRKSAGLIFIHEDHLTNGNDVSLPLLLTGTTITDSYLTEIDKGDSLQVEMQCIDANTYKYWYSLKTGASGESMMATPANPVSNITGGALGYFSAHTSQVKKMKVE